MRRLERVSTAVRLVWQGHVPTFILSLPDSYQPDALTTQLFADVVAGRRIAVLIFGAELHPPFGRSFAIFFGGTTDADRNVVLYFVHSRSFFPREGCLRIGASPFSALTPSSNKPGFGYLPNAASHKCYIVMLHKQDKTALTVPFCLAPPPPPRAESPPVADQPGDEVKLPVVEEKEPVGPAPTDENINVDTRPRGSPKSAEEMRRISRSEISSMFDMPRSTECLLARLSANLGGEPVVGFKRPGYYLFLGVKDPSAAPAHKLAFQQLEYLLNQSAPISLEAIREVAATAAREFKVRPQAKDDPQPGRAYRAVHAAACKEVVSIFTSQVSSNFGRVPGIVLRLLVTSGQLGKYADACDSVASWTCKLMRSNKGDAAVTGFLDGNLGPHWRSFMPA